MRLFLFLLLFIPTICFAQNRIEVTEQVVSIDGKSRNSLTVQVLGVDAEEVKKAWKKQLKDLKGKVSEKTILFGDDCEYKPMGENTFDVYSLVEKITDDVVRLVVTFDLGGADLSSTQHPDQYTAGEQLVRDFAVAQAKSVVQQEIETSQKLLKGFEKDLSGLEKDKEKLEKDIQDYEKKIEENKSSITKNNTEQTNKQKEVHRLEGTQIDGQIEEVQNLIKDFKKEIAGLAKDNKGLEKDNQSLTSKIKEAKVDIEKSLKDQSNKKTEIENVETVIKELEMKLNTIN